LSSTLSSGTCPALAVTLAEKEFKDPRDRLGTSAIVAQLALVATGVKRGLRDLRAQSAALDPSDTVGHGALAVLEALRAAQVGEGRLGSQASVGIAGRKGSLEHGVQ